MNQPTLSVILPNYNHAHFVGEALEAMLNQSFQPLEVIVVDDGSTDNSVTVIKQLAKRYPLINLICNDQNRGTVFSVSRALSLASGDYVYGAASDDKVLPGFFEKAMNLLAQYPQAGLCCTDYAILDNHTGITRNIKLFWGDKPFYFSPEKLGDIIQGGFIAGITSIVKRSAQLDAGGFIPELKWHCDWFAMLLIGFRHGICYIPEPLALLRARPSSFSTSGRKNWAAQSEVISHLLHLLTSPDYRDVLPLFQRSGALAHFRFALVRLMLGHPEHWNHHTLSLIPRSLWYGGKRAWYFIILQIRYRVENLLRFMALKRGEHG